MNTQTSSFGEERLLDLGIECAAPGDLTEFPREHRWSVRLRGEEAVDDRSAAQGLLDFERDQGLAPERFERIGARIRTAVVPLREECAVVAIPLFLAGRDVTGLVLGGAALSALIILVGAVLAIRAEPTRA